MLSGDNGILQKATDAKTYSNEAQIKESVQLAYTAAIADGQGVLTKINLRNELIKQFGEDGYELSEDTTTNEWIISVNEVERLRINVGVKANTVEITYITFTIGGAEYTVREGMTFRQWIEEMNPTYYRLSNKYSCGRPLWDRMGSTSRELPDGFRFWWRLGSCR